MKRAIGLALGVMLAMATMQASAENTQQTKMTTCNADAKTKGLSGDDRKAFMKTCLSSAPAASGKTLTPQQQKMKDCNADAKTKELAGADRKKFMSDCLKGPAAPK